MRVAFFYALSARTIKSASQCRDADICKEMVSLDFPISVFVSFVMVRRCPVPS